MKRITRSHIQQYAQQVAKQFRPDKIILFGSYAYGKPTEDSDLVKLLDLVSPEEPLWEPYRPLLRPISAYAVDFRYPGESADKGEAAEAVKICREFRKVARYSLGLPK